MLKWARIFAAGFFTSAFFASAPVSAQSPGVFLKTMAGAWRGTGTAYISDKAKNAPVRCKITSTFDAAKRQLSNKGRCATAQKRSRVSGSISYSATGNKLSGSYISSFGDTKMTSSTGSIAGNTLTIYSTFVDNSVSRISRIRNVIQRVSGRKFIVTVYEKTGDSYIRRGKITFTK